MVKVQRKKIVSREEINDLICNYDELVRAYYNLVLKMVMHHPECDICQSIRKGILKGRSV